MALTLYLDSSALVKRYVNEVGSDWVRAQCSPGADNEIVTALISKTECFAALAGKLRHSALTTQDYERIRHDLAQDFAHSYLLINTDVVVIDLATELVSRQRLRGYDAVQLATALILNTDLVAAQRSALTFITADGDLLQAARNEGLIVDNPTWHP